MTQGIIEVCPSTQCYFCAYCFPGLQTGKNYSICVMPRPGTLSSASSLSSSVAFIFYFSPPEYLIKVQAFIPVALCVLHNIITSHNEPENNSIMQDWAASIEWGDGIEEDTSDEEIRFEDGGEAEAEVDEIGPVDSKALHDTIAEAMWNDYQGYLQTRGEL